LNGQLVDVLVINETKLNEKHDDSTFDHPCFENYRLDRQNSGGGAVLVYVKKNLNPSRVTFDDHSEMISFIITIEKQLIGILACYRPLYTANETNFFSSLNKQLNNFEDLKTSEILIVGDLNFNMDNFQHSSKLSDFNSNLGSQIRFLSLLDF
jgi:exonuclease III